MQISYLTILPEIFGSGCLTVSWTEKQDQPTPKLQPLVRADVMQREAVINPKVKQSRYWRQGAVLAGCKARGDPAPDYWMVKQINFGMSKEEPLPLKRPVGVLRFLYQSRHCSG